MLPRAAFPKERIGIEEFFNWVGLWVYPSCWSDTDISTLDPRLAVPSGIHKPEHARARIRAIFVSNELHHALTNGVLSAEVEFYSFEKAPAWMKEMGGEKVYYTVTREAWLNGAVADWNKGTIEFNSKYFRDYQFDSDLNQIFEDQDLELFAYIRDPERALNRLVDLTRETLANIGRLTNIRTHLWGEIAGVIWRELALSKSRISRGSRKKLVDAAQDYLDRIYAKKLGPLEPSDSQLWVAVNHAIAQFENSDSSSSVVPTFARDRSTAKRPKSGTS